MADKTWNKNVRFNMSSEDVVQAWSLLHSAEVDRIVEQVTADSIGSGITEWCNDECDFKYHTKSLKKGTLCDDIITR